jgi:hypothetical protein
MNLEDGGALDALRRLAAGLSPDGVGCANLVKLLNQGAVSFCLEADHLPTGRASEVIVRLKPNESMNRLVAAVEAGDRDLHAFVELVSRHLDPPNDPGDCGASPPASEVRQEPLHNQRRGRADRDTRDLGSFRSLRERWDIVRQEFERTRRQGLPPPTWFELDLLTGWRA